jgi:hypothetical protein
MQQRINKMYAGDRLWGIGFIIALWLAVGLVFFAVRHLVEDRGVSLALIISAILIVGYNTASLIAMITHYGHDKDWIYGIDIRHLDEQKRK